QTPYISSHDMGFRFSEEASEGRHDIVAAFAYRLHYAVHIAAVQPDAVAQVGRTQHLIAAAVSAVAGDAGGVRSFSQRGLDRIGGGARQAAHIVRDVFHFLGT